MFAAAALFLVGLIVLVTAAQLVVNAHRRRVSWLIGYFTNDATQLVHLDSLARWVLSDHIAQRRGRGLAVDFRRRVFAHLASEADQHLSTIVMATDSEKLALIHTQDMAQLRICNIRHTVNGPTWKLRRDPQAGRSNET